MTNSRVLSYARGEIWLVNLNPNKGQEPGKTTPVLIIQTNFLNEEKHPTCVICPISSQLQNPNLLRIPLTVEGLEKNSILLIDQVCSIDVEKRLLKLVGKAPAATMMQVDQCLRLLLDIL